MTTNAPSGGDATQTAFGDAESLDMHARLQRGTAIDRYVVLSPIGEGGMGLVVRAYDPKLHREVALKLIKTHSRTPGRIAAARARLLREAQSMAQLSHPNVVPVFDVGSCGDDLFVAMEFVDGDSLRDWLAAQPRSVREIVDVFAQVAQGLLAAHSVGLVHRDLKPGNLLVGRDGRVRVVDFGLARVMGADGEDSHHSASDVAPRQEHLTTPLTEAGAVVGTPVYMAPEQHRGQAIDHRSDQYSFCLTLYEALYGRRPFDAKNNSALARQKNEGPPLPGGRADVPRWLAQLILRGLSPLPDARFASMAEIVALLSRRRRRLSTRIALVASLGIAGVAAWANSAGDDDACAERSTQADAVWNEARATAIAEAFGRSATPYAAQAWTRTRAVLGAYFSRWHEVRIAACEAHQRREQSSAWLVARDECLDGARQRADALLRALESPTPTRIAGATLAASDLVEPDACLEAAQSPAISEPASAADPVSLATLADLSARYALGEGSEVLDAAVRLDDQARTLADERLQAHTAFLHGALLLRVARWGPADAALQRAYFIGGRLQLGELAAHAANLLAETHAALARYDSALDWTEHAQMMVRREGLPPRWTAGALDRAAAILALQGDRLVALEKSRAALALAESSLGDAHPESALIASHVASHLAALGRADEADAAFADALDRLGNALGPAHPEVAKVRMAREQR